MPADLDKSILDTFDPGNLPDDFYADPYRYYRLFREHDPVHLCPDGSYFLTRHADLFTVYRNHKVFSSDKKQQFKPAFGDSLLYEHHTTSLVFNDPPLHTQVRKAIGDALSPKTVAAMEPGLREMINDLLDDIEKKTEFDLMTDFAGIIPVEVIGNLLRVPHGDRKRFQRWAAAILGALEFNLPKENFDLGNKCVEEFIAYLEVLVDERRHNLSEDSDDVLSRLIRWESDGFKLSSNQLYHQCIFMLNAGHETTTNLIGNGVYALYQHGDQLEKLKQEPELINSAVEEFLRFEAPVQLGNRTTTEEYKLAGVPLVANINLTLSLGAANRDPDAYDDPDRLDITRNPTNHMAFAGGIHTCAGLNVARIEARIAIPALLERFPELHLNGEPVRDKRARFRALLALPMLIN